MPSVALASSSSCASLSSPLAVTNMAVEVTGNTLASAARTCGVGVGGWGSSTAQVLPYSWMMVVVQSWSVYSWIMLASAVRGLVCSAGRRGVRSCKPDTAPPSKTLMCAVWWRAAPAADGLN
jgi:hypothetical protein